MYCKQTLYSTFDELNAPEAIIDLICKTGSFILVFSVKRSNMRIGTGIIRSEICKMKTFIANVCYKK